MFRLQGCSDLFVDELIDGGSPPGQEVVMLEQAGMTTVRYVQ
jgi:hypothetical protein